MNQEDYNRWLADLVKARFAGGCLEIKDAIRRRPTRAAKYWMAPVKLASTKRFDWEMWP